MINIKKKIIVLGQTTLAKAITESLRGARLGTISDVQSGDVVISTQGTNRGTSKKIIDRCFTEIIEQAESVEKIASRFIVIGSMGAEYSSWPGIDNQRMIYNISKASLEKWAQDYNQMNCTIKSGIVGMRIQICEPSAFQTRMSKHTGMPLQDIVDSVQYLVQNPSVIKIQLRK